LCTGGKHIPQDLLKGMTFRPPNHLTDLLLLPRIRIILSRKVRVQLHLRQPYFCLLEQTGTGFLVPQECDTCDQVVQVQVWVHIAEEHISDEMNALRRHRRI
jgi:hypothetical protein